MNTQNLSLTNFSEIRDIVYFAEHVLGIELHDGQKHWLRNSWKIVNVLKPANQWGKTTAEAICHIYQAVCKPQLDRFDLDFDSWFAQRYPCLNFGKTYEIAKGVQEAILDIVEGRYLLPTGKMNQSMLAGWAISKVEEAPKLPRIKWFNNSETLIRSYDGLGESFKRLRLAFVSGDECGDIPELHLFLNGTLMPRTAFFQGSIHLVGTSQPKGIEYEEIAALGEEDMFQNKDNATYFVLSFSTNPEYSSVYTNTFMPKEHIKLIESTADPELRKQIIYGQYVDYGKHLYEFDEVRQMFNTDIPYDPISGFSITPHVDGFYVFAVDVAASEDETSCTAIEFNRKYQNKEGVNVPLPHRVVYHRFWKGKIMPLSLQYEVIKQDFLKFKTASPKKCYFVYDAASLGGKNAEQAFSDLGVIYPFPPRGRGAADVKAEGMGKVKEVLSRGRKVRVGEKGEIVDLNTDWGFIKASPQLVGLRRQLETAALDDKILKTDQFMSFMMGLHFVEGRIAKTGKTRVSSFNIYGAMTR